MRQQTEMPLYLQQRKHGKKNYRSSDQVEVRILRHRQVRNRDQRYLGRQIFKLASDINLNGKLKGLDLISKKVALLYQVRLKQQPHTHMQSQPSKKRRKEEIRKYMTCALQLKIYHLS